MYIIKVTMQKNAVSLQMGVMMSFIILTNSFLRAILFILDIVNKASPLNSPPQSGRGLGGEAFKLLFI